MVVYILSCSFSIIFNHFFSREWNDTEIHVGLSNSEGTVLPTCKYYNTYLFECLFSFYYLHLQVWCITTPCQGFGETLMAGNSVSVCSSSLQRDGTSGNHGTASWSSSLFFQNGFQNGTASLSNTQNEIFHILCIVIINNNNHIHNHNQVFRRARVWIVLLRFRSDLHKPHALVGWESVSEQR